MGGILYQGGFEKKLDWNIVEGEFGPNSTTYNVLPEFVPKPFACGTYTTSLNTHSLTPSVSSETQLTICPTLASSLLGK